MCQDFYFSPLVINLACGSVKLMSIDFSEKCEVTTKKVWFSEKNKQYIIIDYVLPFLKSC